MQEVERLLAEFVDIDPEDYWVDGAWDLPGLRDDVRLMRQDRGVPQQVPPGYGPDDVGDAVEEAKTKDEPGTFEPDTEPGAARASSGEGSWTGSPDHSSLVQPSAGSLPSRQETVALTAETRLLRHQIEHLVKDLRSIRESMQDKASSQPSGTQAWVAEPVPQPQEQRLATATKPAPQSESNPMRAAPKLQVDPQGDIFFSGATDAESSEPGEKWQEVLLMLERLEEQLTAKK